MKSYLEPGIKEDTWQESCLCLWHFFFFQIGSSPTEKVSSGPQGSAINYFCSGLKQVLSLTLDYAPPYVWRCSASLILLSCCLAVTAQTWRYSLIQSTVDSNWLPWCPTILQGSVQMPPVVAPSCVQEPLLLDIF